MKKKVEMLKRIIQTVSEWRAEKIYRKIESFQSIGYNDTPIGNKSFEVKIEIEWYLTPYFQLTKTT